MRHPLHTLGEESGGSGYASGKAAWEARCLDQLRALQLHHHLYDDSKYLDADLLPSREEQRTY